jgi:F420-dependent oxidoreductase-like protein
MRLGIFHSPTTINAYIDECKAIAEEGFHSIWSPQIFGHETMAVIAMAAKEVPGITFGTAVVPTYPRHPTTMAQLALTASEASEGRFVLGIGLSHQVVIEGMFGMSFNRPAAHMREYLAILRPLINERKVNFTGETLTYRGGLQLPPIPPVPVLIAALAPAMLKLAGSVADGTVTWMTGARTIEEHINPVMHRAATDAGRPTPQTAAGIPVCVTTDIAGARERAAKEFAIYGQLPSYRAMLDREGLGGPEDLAVIGDERTVEAAVKRFASSGVTELVANIFGSAADRARTRELLGSLL